MIPVLLSAILLAAADEKELRETEKQLEKFTGPLLFLVEESRLSMQDLLKTLKRDRLFPENGTLTDDELKLWLFRAENEFMPRNEKMCAIVRASGTPAEGSFAALLEHQDSWRALHERWKKEGVPYEWRSKTPFPRGLGGELADSFSKLQKRRRELSKDVPGAELRWIDRQLAELYRPLKKFNEESREEYGQILEDLNRGAVFPLKGPEDVKIWLSHVEGKLLPKNEERRSTIEAKLFLIEGDEIPAPIQRLLDHTNSWKFNHLRWQKEKIEYSWRSNSGWPGDFNLLVDTTIKKLEERRAALAEPKKQ